MGLNNHHGSGKKKTRKAKQKVACASKNPPRLGALPRSKQKGGEVFTLIQRSEHQ